MTMETDGPDAGAASPCDAPLSPPPEDDKMEIHKPKPVHSWKEFFTELGTIVLGILIALGLEQSVEAARERGLARESEAAIHAELAENVSRISYRLSHQACMEKRLDEIAVLLSDWADGKEIPPGLHIGVAGDVAPADQRWQANLNSERFSREADAVQTQQSALYASLRLLGQEEATEVNDWSQLRALELGTHFLTPAYRPALIQAFLSARDQAMAVGKIGAGFVARAKAAGADPDQVYHPAVPDSTCQPMRPAADNAAAAKL